jgi:hypothetical protein
MMIKAWIFALILCFLSFPGPHSWAGNKPLNTEQQATLKAVQLSETDRDAIARVTFAEAANQGDTGLAAVVFVILNRLVSGKFGSSITEILNAKNQFEPVTRAGGWQNLPPLGPQQRARVDTIINLSLDGRLPDPTNGSLYFQNPATVAQREAAGEISKGLTRFNGSDPAAVIQDHEFYAKINAKEAAPVLVQAENQSAPEPWDIYRQASRQDLQENASWDVFGRKENKIVH